LPHYTGNTTTITFERRGVSEQRTSFELRLPCSLGSEYRMRRGRILVVEDDDTLRRVTQIQLEKKGYSTATAGDAVQALGILENEYQDLVISDLHLPGVSGLELLKRIRAKYPETEVVMITAFGTVVTAVEAMKFGAYDYVTKPIHLYELSALVDRVF